jgi:chaperone required for assembly of F1-ATPase
MVDNDTNVPKSQGGPKSPPRDSLRGPLPKRFYKEAGLIQNPDGFEITLDGRSVRTPLKRALRLEDKAFADRVVSEWAGQGEFIDPATMPATRLANSATDTVADNRSAVAAEIVAYAGSDLVCYRAGNPSGLVARQAEIWDPILAAVEARIGARFVRAEGIVHAEQPAAVAKCVAAAIDGLPELQLAALQLITTLTGSAVLAIALAHNLIDADAAWAAAHVDEDWQISLWGGDVEAEDRRALRERDFRAAVATFSHLR